MLSYYFEKVKKRLELGVEYWASLVSFGTLERSSKDTGPETTSTHLFPWR